MRARKFIILIVFFVTASLVFGEAICLGATNPSAFTIARLKYGGGGDWYWGTSAVPNMLKFLKENTNVPVNEEEVRVSVTGA